MEEEGGKGKRKEKEKKNKQAAEKRKINRFRESEWPSHHCLLARPKASAPLVARPRSTLGPAAFPKGGGPGRGEEHNQQSPGPGGKGV